MGPDAANAPVCLLIHGTGAATHSWRALMPLLAKQFRVVAMDLPGHGFTKSGVTGNVTLAGMAASLAALLDEQKCTPDLIVGPARFAIAGSCAGTAGKCLGCLAPA